MLQNLKRMKLKERQIPHDFTNMWNLRNKQAKKKRERQTKK